MNPLTKIALFLVDLVLPLAVGYALVRRRRLGPNTLDPMMTAAILIVAPALGLLSSWAVEISSSLIWLAVIGVAMQLIAGGAGFLRARTKDQDDLEKGSYVLSAILSNRGLVGGLSVFILFGEQGFALSRLVILLGAPVLYGLCFPVARYFHASHHRAEQSRRSVLSALFDVKQVALAGLVVGFALNFTGVARPPVFGQVFKALIHVIAWMVLIPVGSALDFGEIRRYWRSVVDLLPLKFVITPVLVYALGWAVGLKGMELAVLLVVACSPTAINAVVAAKLHDLNVHVATAAFVLTTAVYLVVVFPVIMVIAAVIEAA